MRSASIKTLVLGAVMTAFVTVVTMTFQIPIGATSGYVNVGDAVIFTTAILLGRRMGFLAGGLGSALADLLTGYAHWAPWTFIIKGIEGLIAALIGYREGRQKAGLATIFVATLVAAAWMVLGYFITAGIIYTFPAAFGDIPHNLAQGGASIALSLPLIFALRRVVK